MSAAIPSCPRLTYGGGACSARIRCVSPAVSTRSRTHNNTGTPSQQGGVEKEALRRVAVNRSLTPSSLNPPATETDSGGEHVLANAGDCPICCERMEKGKAVFVTECGHAFHFACLQGYDSTGELPCPICRAHLSEPPILLKNRRVEAEWFYRITRAEAEALLTADGRNGVFLVRESHTRKGTFTLSFLHDGLPRHCRIFNTLDGQFAADSYKAFDTLEDLVEWYRTHAIVGGTDGTALLCLTYPCSSATRTATTRANQSAPIVVARHPMAES